MTEAQQWVRVFVPLAVGIVWPILVGILVFGFRGPLRELIGRIRVIKSAIGTAEFAESLREATGQSNDEDLNVESSTAPALPGGEPELMETRGGASAAEAARQRAAAYVGSTVFPFPTNLRSQREWKLHFPNSESLLDRANDNPLYSILTGYVVLERWLDRALLSHGKNNYEGITKLSVSSLAQMASNARLISDESVTRIHALTHARNIAAHKPEDITKFMALDFLYALDDLFRDLEKELPAATVDIGPDLYPAP